MLISVDSIETIFCLDLDPLSKERLLFLTFSTSAKNRISSSLASPSLAGAPIWTPRPSEEISVRDKVDIIILPKNITTEANSSSSSSLPPSSSSSLSPSLSFQCCQLSQIIQETPHFGLYIPVCRLESEIARMILLLKFAISCRLTFPKNMRFRIFCIV